MHVDDAFAVGEEHGGGDVEVELDVIHELFFETVHLGDGDAAYFGVEFVGEVDVVEVLDGDQEAHHHQSSISILIIY